MDKDVAEYLKLFVKHTEPHKEHVKCSSEIDFEKEIKQYVKSKFDDQITFYANKWEDTAQKLKQRNEEEKRQKLQKYKLICDTYGEKIITMINSFMESHVDSGLTKIQGCVILRQDCIFCIPYQVYEIINPDDLRKVKPAKNAVLSYISSTSIYIFTEKDFINFEIETSPEKIENNLVKASIIEIIFNFLKKCKFNFTVTEMITPCNISIIKFDKYPLE